MDTKSEAPSSSKEFDKVYKSSFKHWIWTDTRIPNELKELVEQKKPITSLEFGCGFGKFSTYLAEQGIRATGVDFSPVAIEKANKKIAQTTQKPILIVGDVTNLAMLKEPFDVAIDVGCFHCLNETQEKKYVNEAYRLLKQGSTLLIWALDSSPIGIKLTPDYIKEVFGEHFQLDNSKFSRRRIASSHWYWLTRKD
jgi:cyclopropane fatty-acyl-phospholipid synthase-like methyltransferase